MKNHEARFVRSAGTADDLLRDDLPKVAFVGRSNVGKSSLLNRLLGRRKLARTSSRPGCTRVVNYFLIDERFYFVDLPGYGYAAASKGDRQAWARLVDAYMRRAARGAEVIQLVDAKVGATPLDRQAFDYLAGLGASVTLVATKADHVPASRRAAMLRGIRDTLGIEADRALIPFSARSGEGVRELWKHLTAHLANGARSELQNEVRHGKHH